MESKKITKEIFETIISDILNNTDLIDVEKSDALNYLARTYDEFRTEELDKIIDDLY